MYLSSNSAHAVGMIDADAGLAIGEAHEDDAVLEVLAIAGRQSHPTLGIEGVVEGAG